MLLPLTGTNDLHYSLSSSNGTGLPPVMAPGCRTICDPAIVAALRGLAPGGWRLFSTGGFGATAAAAAALASSAGCSGAVQDGVNVTV